MAKVSAAVEDVTSDRSSDPVFAVAAGLYLALLVAPAVLLLTSRTVAAGPAPLYVAFLTTGVGSLVLAWLSLSDRPGLVSRFGGTRLTWAPSVLAGSILVVVLAASLSSRVGDGVAFGWIVFEMLATIGGLGVGALARARYAAAIIEGSPADAVWTAGWPAEARRRLYAVGFGVAAVSAVGFVAGVVASLDWLRLLGQFGMPLGFAVAVHAQERTCTATPAGLGIRLPVYTRLLPWSAFEGYSRTDDAIVLHRRWRVDLRFAVDDLADPGDVEAAVVRHLSRRD